MRIWFLRSSDKTVLLIKFISVIEKLVSLKLNDLFFIVNQLLDAVTSIIILLLQSLIFLLLKLKNLGLQLIEIGQYAFEMRSFLIVLFLDWFFLLKL